MTCGMTWRDICWLDSSPSTSVYLPSAHTEGTSGKRGTYQQFKNAFQSPNSLWRWFSAVCSSSSLGRTTFAERARACTWPGKQLLGLQWVRHVQETTPGSIMDLVCIDAAWRSMRRRTRTDTNMLMFRTKGPSALLQPICSSSTGVFFFFF